MPSFAETYTLAQRARYKLANAASRADADLRILVSHANLLDSLTVRIRDELERADSDMFTVLSHQAAKTREIVGLIDNNVEVTVEELDLGSDSDDEWCGEVEDCARNSYDVDSNDLYSTDEEDESDEESEDTDTDDAESEPESEPEEFFNAHTSSTAQPTSHLTRLFGLLTCKMEGKPPTILNAKVISFGVLSRT